MQEETLSYNTPCSGEIYRKINEYEFTRLWKTNLRKNNNNLIWGSTASVFAILAFLTEDYGIAGFLGGFGIAAFSYYSSYYSSYKKSKKLYSEAINQEVENLKNNSTDVIWEYTPTHFYFKNYKSEHRFLWSQVTYCILDEKYLYITAASMLHFILDFDNIDSENLDKTKEYLQAKSKFREL